MNSFTKLIASISASFCAYEKMRFNLLRVFSPMRVCVWAAA